MACAANSTPQPVEAKPCGLTRNEFAQFLKEALYDPTAPAFRAYFFTNAPGTKKHAQRDALDDEVVRCLECGCTIGEHNIGSPPIRLPDSAAQAPVPDHVTQANLRSVNDQVVVGYRQAFREGLTIMGQVNQPSDKLSKCSQEWAKLVKNWDFPCVVCGWKLGVAATYPGEAARIHKVSAAHILSSEKDCGRLGVDFDQTNFLPLCGAKDEMPSCHSAFDRRLLCFVKCAGEGHDRWTIMATDSLYVQFNMKEIDLQQFKPHRRCLHSHALHCIQTNQVIIPTSLPTVNLDTTPPDAEDDPAPEVEWDE